MSQDIDFIKPDFKKIERPHKQTRSSKVLDRSKQNTKSFSIQKSFVCESVSQLHEQLRPEVNELKKFYKVMRERERKEKERREKEGGDQKVGCQQEENGKGLKEGDDSGMIEGFKVDESGQLRDKNGNLVFIKNQKTQLKINKKIELEKQAKQLGKKQRIKYHQRLSRNFLDRNLVISGSKKRIRRSLTGLQLLQQGSYQPYQKQRQKQSINDLNQATKRQQPEQKLIRKRNKIYLQFSRQLPKYQWWDQQIINKQAYLKILQQEQIMENKEINFQEICNLDKLGSEVVYQKVGNLEKKEQKFNIPVYLTKDERKKLKRKRKKQKLMEKNDLIRLGLIQPDKPKLTISNMAIVMKNQFIIDPSRVQAEARRQHQERLNNHLSANSQRKLTKSQKKMKALKKLKKDSAKECRRIVFKLQKLEEPSHVFKVNMNAKQLALNGFILTSKQYHSQPVIVMAEGGQKAIKFFKNLMLNRIRWNDKGDNHCQLAWEGQIQNSKIGKWQTIEVGDESQTIRALTQRGVQNFRQYLL